MFYKTIFGVISILLIASSRGNSLHLPEDNLSMPVMITIPLGNQNMKASGVYYESNRAMYLITAKHVLFEENSTILRTTQTITLTSYNSGGGRDSIGLRLGKLSARGRIKFHPVADVVAIRIAYERSTDTEEVMAVGDLRLPAVTDYSLKTFSESFVSNDVFVFGYPAAIGLPKIPQIEYEKPLIIKGNIAGKNTTNRTLIIACPVYPGNSGGPVVEVEDIRPDYTGFRIIGIISQWIPYTADVYDKYNLGAKVYPNSGYAVVVASDSIIDVLRMFGETFTGRVAAAGGR